MKTANKKAKIGKEKIFYCYPNMVGLGNYYSNDIEFSNIRPTAKEFLKSEIKRMALINEVVAKILVKNKSRKSWAKDFEIHLLRQFLSMKKLNSMSKAEKSIFLTRLMFPKE